MEKFLKDLDRLLKEENEVEVQEYTKEDSMKIKGFWLLYKASTTYPDRLYGLYSTKGKAEDAKKILINKDERETRIRFIPLDAEPEKYGIMGK